MKKQLLLFAMILLPLVASAHDIEVQNADGVTIYYNYINDGTELQVTFGGDWYYSYSNEYHGNVAIPEEVTYMNRTRKVTSIGDYAFVECYGLTSVTIPNSVTSIGYSSFSGCSGLTSITIGNSVTSIGYSSFDGCSGLKKVIVKDIAAWCGIKFNNYDSNPLYYAKHIYSDEDTEIANLIIPNSVTSIGDYAFWYCSGLTSVIIPNSVTSIGNFAFAYCFGLTSITIGNSVTSIRNYAFAYCSGLTSITIPNSVTSIGDYAFWYCYHLTSVIIPNSVTSIGNHAFDGNRNLSVVVSLIENPFSISYVFGDYSGDYSNNATLYVPVGTKEKYQATDGWKDFVNIVEGTPTGIKVIENTQNKNATVYDLNGVRLPAPKKGINIINGQKVVMK